MGDAFPKEVEWFLEFSKKAANLNALLQGLLGRACGYGKNSTVIMSQENRDLVIDYERENGGYFYKTSTHSRVVGPFRRGAPTSLVRISRDMDDPVVNAFFRRVDDEVVKPNINQGTAILSPKRRTSEGPRTGPLLRIAEELGLFEHLENEEFRAGLFPTYSEFQIARATDEVPHSRNSDRILRYALDENGDCRFTFREWAEGGNHGGARSRGYGERDAKDPSKAGDTLEPQINMRKFNSRTGLPIDDKRTNGGLTPRSERKPGDWRAEMITLPLVTPVRELQTGDLTYPVPHSPFAELLSTGERDHAGYD